MEHELDDLLLEKVGEERWREVILIAAGLAPALRAQRLVGALLARQSETAAELEMAGLTLAEDIQLGADLSAEVQRRLLDRLSREEAAGPFRRLAGALMAADLDAARGWMGKELRGRNPQRLKRVLELLPELGEEHARPLTAVVLRLIEMGPGVRTRALHALAGLKVPLDGEILRVLTQVRQEPGPALKNAAAWAWCELGRPEDLGLVRVPAGEFLMGSTEGEGDADANERPQHTLHLPTFYIGRYPVTVGSFGEFLAVGGYKPEPRNFAQWNRHPDHPAVEVSWRDALEYAQWHGMSLPSEAEWEKAARGTDGRRFPWGDDWRPGYANTVETWKSGRPRFLSWLRRSPEFGTTTPVGAFSPHGDSPYGCADMSGNVWEWTRSIFEPYPYDPSDGREDVQNLKRLRVLRGGSFIYYSRLARCAYRYRIDPVSRNVIVGFRVVLLPFSSDL